MRQKSEQQSQRLAQLLHHIEGNLHTPIDVESLARVSHWSRWQLQRVFNAHTGLSVAQYVRQLRLSQSAMQLISGDQRHLDIALNNGFESEVSFSRAFRQHFGCTPGEYRRQGIPSGIRFPLSDTPMHSIRLQRRPAFTLQGQYCDTYGVFSAQADFAEKVPTLWQSLHNTLLDARFSHPLNQDLSGESDCGRINDNKSPLFAVIDVARYGSARLRYWAGYQLTDELSARQKSPQQQAALTELSTLQVPEQLYAVITHIGPLNQLPDTITWFISHWLNHSPYEAFEGFDIEEYGDHKGQSRVDYWIPIRPVQVN